MESRPKKERTGYLYKRGKDGKQIEAGSRKCGIYYLQYTVNGKRYRECLDTSSAEVAEQLRKQKMAPLQVADEKEALGAMKQRLEAVDDRLQALDDDKNPPVAIKDAWDVYLKAPNRPDSGARTIKGYESQFRMFSAWIGKNYPQCQLLRHVTPAIAEEYATYLLSEVKIKVKVKKKEKDKIIKAAFSTNTYNKHVRLLELVFRVLQSKAKMTFNPWADISRKTENKASRREFTVEEINNICNKAEGELKLLLLLGIYTGMRLGDCCTLRWSETDMDRRLILRVPGKIARRKNQPVHIPIHSTLFSFLNEIPKSSRKVYVLPQMAAAYGNNDSDVTKMLRKHFTACGIQVHSENTGKGTGTRAVVEVGFHSLRHSFVSLCRQANTPLSVVEAIVGHSNPAMTRHYTHVGDLAASQAVAALPSLVGDMEAKSKASEYMDPILESLQSMNARNWETTRDKLIAAIMNKSR
jgi:integrase